jgi:DNA-directed RNA polymerase subunit RPC12/RpoP
VIASTTENERLPAAYARGSHARCPRCGAPKHKRRPLCFGCLPHQKRGRKTGGRWPAGSALAQEALEGPVSRTLWVWTCINCAERLEILGEPGPRRRCGRCGGAMFVDEDRPSHSGLAGVFAYRSPELA